MSQPSSPISPTKPKRRNSLKEQWDTTTKVVNVKQKFHSYVVDKYTELQKATFTKWVNIQLRMIDINQLNSNKKIPEIKSIDKDFRDGKKLIQLLEILYPNDPELPKIERGKTRHHHIANVNNVLEFLKKRLDEKSLIALEAIGAVDIVDGNVKLTLGLIWLTTSKFLNMFSVQFEVTEEELEQEELLDVPNTIIEEEVDIETLLHDDHSEQKTFTEDNLENSSTSSQNNKTSQPLPSQIKVTIPSLPTPMANKRLQDLSKSEKRLSLPIFQTNNNNNLTINPTKISSSNSKPFRTLRLNSSPINSNTSNLLFWINMQLINYSSLLPSSNYPLEDFIGLNDGIVLSALIQYLNIEWKMDDLNLLDPDDIKNDKDEFCEEIKTKERLSKCFDIIEKKLNVRQPKALISMLIEKDYNDKERLKRTGLAWSVYIKHVVRIIDYDAIHYQSPSNDRHKKHKKSRGCLPFYTSNDEDSFWTPSAASLIVMIWEWTLHCDTDLFFEV
ncbi:4180_t:CDS:2 [Rhizophagus irregularis]|nr:4180_t:CDS:2 [Rhizophagus irregularis]